MKFLIISSFFFCTLCLASTGDKYAIYTLTPQGGTRVTGMGGAYAGLSDDVQGINYNPSGLVMGKWWADAGGNANFVLNQEADLNNDGKNDGLPHIYLYYAGALKFGSIAFGTGISSPYHSAIPFESIDGLGFKEKREITLSVSSLDFPIAYRLSKNFSLGVTFHNMFLTESYKFTSENSSNPALFVEAKTYKPNITYGIMYLNDSESFGFGYSFRPQVLFKVDESLNSRTNGVNWFKSAFLPSRSILGMHWHASQKLTFVFDADYYTSAKDLVYVGSELVAGFNRIEIDPNPKLVFHGGGEFRLVETTMWDVYLRLGGYFEPSRLRGKPGRFHSTQGFEARWWLLVLSAALDTSSNFLNGAGGIGLSFKSVF